MPNMQDHSRASPTQPSHTILHTTTQFLTRPQSLAMPCCRRLVSLSAQSLREEARAAVLPRLVAGMQQSEVNMPADLDKAFAVVRVLRS